MERKYLGKLVNFSIVFHRLGQFLDILDMLTVCLEVERKNHMLLD